tara:strand:+ start:686 stop:1138 length:453 start_codon:yes stop_codon:yes gene_type:complete
MEHYTNITFVSSKLCSGKTTLAKGYLETIKPFYDKVDYIEISDIVRRAMQTDDREKLQDGEYLDMLIIDCIAAAAGCSDHVIVSGARQASIVECFPRATHIWMEVPEEVRYDRFQNSIKDADLSQEGFANANKRDEALGIDKVKQHIFNK